MEFLDIGVKIKKIRKQLKMKHEELTNSNLSIESIRMIENGKRIPSETDYNTIIEGFNRRAKELGILLDIDKNYLSRTAKEDATNYCAEVLSNTNSLNDIKSIISIARHYKLNLTLAGAYKKLGDIVYSYKDYASAFRNYMNAFNCYELDNFSINYPYLYNRMGLCKLNQLEYLESLACFRFANHYSEVQRNEDIREKSFYNISLCYKKLGDIDEALKYIDIYMSVSDKRMNMMLYAYANILKANCYEAQGKIEASIQILKALIDDFTERSQPILGYIYSTIGSNYLSLGNFTKSLDYFNISERIRREADIANLSHSLIEKAFVYKKQNMYHNAILLLEEGLKLASENNDEEYKLKAYYALSDICI